MINGFRLREDPRYPVPDYVPGEAFLALQEAFRKARAAEPDLADATEEAIRRRLQRELAGADFTTNSRGLRTLARVMWLFLDQPLWRRAELMRELHLQPIALCRLLGRFKRLGWLVAPPRREVHLTPVGEQWLLDLVE